MGTVVVLPEGITFEAEDGQTIMDAAHDAGLFWPTTCGGQGICTTCTCAVEAGAESLDEMGRAELKTLTEDLSEATIRSRRLRLACQARVSGDVTVTKRGVRPDA
ncbi:MAG TPA: 2Fe-2S iron-sulfur cluster-binding protein [Dehalococcoidia bacterium]|nr:2Fe-2S iron-sulfur cluster-binding protein [Dehalococcoidia bacterium]